MIHYRQHFGLKFDPLGKKQSGLIDDKQYTKMLNQLNWTLQCNGVGVVTGEAGVGKTANVRRWAEQLNPLTHHVIYQSDNHFKPFDIYSQLAESLGLEILHRYSRLWRSIKQELLHLNDEKKITPVWILDEAQELPLKFFADLPAFLNFNFDTRDLIVIILVGTPKLQSIIKRSVHSSLASRIHAHFHWQAIDNLDEFQLFITEAFQQAGCQQMVIGQSAIAMIHMASKGRLRNAHRVITKALQLAAINKLNHVPDEIIKTAIEQLQTSCH